jgi:signal transduction histidine kinase
VQDAALAALLLAGAWAAIGRGGASADGGWFAEVVWLREPPVTWALIGVCAGAVAVRRSRPIAAFAAAGMVVIAEMALALGPLPTDLAVPIVLYTVAVQRRRKVSLAVLAAALAAATAWSVHVALDGKPDGRRHEDVSDQTQPPPPPGEPAPGRGQGPASGETTRGNLRSTDLGPTDWGGIPVLGGLPLAAWAIGWGVRSRRAYLGELRARALDAERERDQRAALAVAAERARITRELHDVVAHGLAVIVMQAQGGVAAFAKRPADTLTALDTIVTTGRASLADMRQVLSASGQAEVLTAPVPGLAQLHLLIDRVCRAGTAVQLHINGSPRPLPAGVDVSSYRIVQEALTNTMKHAGPDACAQVVVTYESDGLRLEVSDNGVGEPGPGLAGNGVRGMRERVALLGGELTAGPGPDGGGYLVQARLPLTREDSA